ncbi:MAG: response regulator transcription factor [Anaerolineales bacterium]|nr:response regulator transcription factor [Anaerolineales bacterium]
MPADHSPVPPAAKDPPLRVLVIEDELKLARLVEEVLTSAGCEVRLLAEPTEVALAASRWQPDVVLLDLVLRGVAVGQDLTYALRAVTAAPIILVTAQRGGNGLPSGLERLVDDVLWKPFAAGELLRRVRMAADRHRSGDRPGGGVIVCGDLRMDDLHRRVFLSGRQVSLTSGEYGLLRMLAQHADREVAAQDLLMAVWGAAFADDLEYLEAYICHLREKVEADPANPRRLLAGGHGYRLACPGAAAGPPG